MSAGAAHRAYTKGLVDWIAAATSLPRESILFSAQKTTEPLGDFCRLTIDGSTPYAPLAEDRVSDAAPDVQIDHLKPLRMHVFVEFYSTTNRPETDAFALAEDAASAVDLLDVRDALATAGLVPIECGRIHCLDAQMSGVWQKQAKFTAHFRITSSVVETVGTIEHVVVVSPDLGIPDTTIDLD